MERDKTMEKIKSLNIAIVGGGVGCKAIMDMISAEKLSQLGMKLIGLACTNTAAAGYRFAREKGIYTTTDYRDLFKLKDLNMIIELTDREETANDIARSKPEHVGFMDHEAARLLWDIFQIEEQRIAERRRTEDRIEHLNLVLRAIRNVNKLITRERDIERLLKLACEKLTETRGYYNVWIALLDKSGGFVKSAEAGLGEGFLPMIESLQHGDLTDCVQRALSQSQAVITEDPYFDCPDCPMSGMYGGKAGMTVRFEYGEKVYGILCASIPDDFISDKEEQILLKEVADDIAFAIHDIELERERNQALEKVKETARKLQAVFKSVNDTLSIMDKSLTVQEVNKYRLELSGLNRDQVIGKKCYKVFQQRDKPCDICPVQPVFEKGEAVRLEQSTVFKDGTVKYFDAQATPIFDNDGNIFQVVSLARDITSRKRAEEALLESEEKYKILVEHSLTGVFIHQDGKYVFVNDKFAQIHGYAPEELLGKEYLTLLPPDDRAKFAEIVSKRLEGAFAPFQYEVQRLRKDGKIIWCEMMANCIEYGGSPAIMGNIIEITDRRQAEKSLQVAYDQSIIYAHELKEEIEEHKRVEEEKKKLEAQLLHAQKMESIGTLAGGVAHDFNNLLMGIQGYASLVLNDLDETNIHYHWVKSIEDQVRSGAGLTRQLLGFAMGGKYHVRPTDINEIVRKSLSMFGRTKKEITVNEKYEQDLWTVEVDRGQMEQVLLNLYVNAWQAMPAGGYLYLETSNVTLDESDTKPYGLQSGRYVHISVTDTGTGMDEVTQQMIFDPFFTTKEKGWGTGLGLASAYGIIKNHGGIINVNSIKGHGSTFNIFLPAAETVADDKESVFGEGELKRGSETILLVDDEQTIIDVGKELLSRLGYKVLSAERGQEALDVLKGNKDKIDLVILDMIMPVMSGGEVYKRIKQIRPDVKVLLSSGYSIDGEATEILKTGCNGFIQKPFSIKELSGKIREILEV
jgi:two-component system, cell cycle sensor histidine kinase and response regulator CckA